MLRGLGQGLGSGMQGCGGSHADGDVRGGDAEGVGFGVFVFDGVHIQLVFCFPGEDAEAGCHERADGGAPEFAVSGGDTDADTVVQLKSGCIFCLFEYKRLRDDGYRCWFCAEGGYKRCERQREEAQKCGEMHGETIR